MARALQFRFMGVGNARASRLGSAAGVLEVDGAPALLIDCGPRTLDDFEQHYRQQVPPAVFLTHLHMDHIGGVEQLFYRAYFHDGPRVELFVPAPLVAGLHEKLATSPHVLSEGRANFWDAFHLVPTSGFFWCRSLLFEVFPVRHSGYRGAYGIALRGSFLYSGDTRPIPEVVSTFASGGETVFHDCGLHSSPAHTGLEDVLREYPMDIRDRMVAYHYESESAGRELEAAGLRIARTGQCFALRPPLRETGDPDG